MSRDAGESDDHVTTPIGWLAGPAGIAPRGFPSADAPVKVPVPGRVGSCFFEAEPMRTITKGTRLDPIVRALSSPLHLSDHTKAAGATKRDALCLLTSLRLPSLPQNLFHRSHGLPGRCTGGSSRDVDLVSSSINERPGA